MCVSGGLPAPAPLGETCQDNCAGPTSPSDADRSLGVGVPRDRMTTAQHPPHPRSRAARPQPRRGQWARPGVPGEGLFVQRGGDTGGVQCRQRPPPALGGRLRGCSKGGTPARRQGGRHGTGAERYPKPRTSWALISQLFPAARDTASIFSCFYQTNVFN